MTHLLPPWAHFPPSSEVLELAQLQASAVTVLVFGEKGCSVPRLVYTDVQCAPGLGATSFPAPCSPRRLVGAGQQFVPQCRLEALKEITMTGRHLFLGSA